MRLATLAGINPYTDRVKIESPDFTQVDVRAFLDETLDQEREHLARRLETSSARLAELVRRGIEDGGPRAESWSGHDVLAHIVVLSKFYGMLVSQVGSGKMTDVDVLNAAQSRDVAAESLRSVPAEQLLRLTQRDHQRTAAYLRSADAAALARRATLYPGFTMSAQEIAALPLCAHLEIHLDQLERTLAR